MSNRLQLIVGGTASVALLAAVATGALPGELTLLETLAVVTSAWTTWLLANNRVLGWWIGLVAVVLYAVVFYRVRLFAEVVLQGIYFVTSLQAIFIWLRGGADHHGRPVGRMPPAWNVLAAVFVVLSTLAAWRVLIAVRGAAPFWDALTMILSLVAHLYLMGRYVESWYIWIIVDIIYIPLFASRGLFLTAGLYATFLAMAVVGLRNFQLIYLAQHAEASRGPTKVTSELRGWE
ncbi:MAG: nicotinamide riboside transporter PnuC [Acidobacteria bacterium]|nr:nicotinamide riboside transporter PnuC [Acidobacteriota bacterium]MCA1650054.1 nicotinamide riboside transporter PnuC [Acidobacteriota bacterium]